MKKTFIISYDVTKGYSFDYKQISDYFKAYGTWAKITESTWAIVTDKKATEVRDEIVSLLPVDSRVFVIKSGTIGAWRNTIGRSEWLKKHL
nr:CRISPR-associated protein Cas2 [Pseudopedobacter sp.]